jgi:hypothetical protein
MPNIILSLNSSASAFVVNNGDDEPPRKMRVDATLTKAEGIRVRPTNRKAGPHILLDLKPKGKNLSVEIEEDVFERMVADGLPSSFFQAGEKYSILCDRYKWLVLLPGEDHEASVGIATASSRKA